MFGEPILIVLLGDVGDVHPGMRHFVDRAVAPANPLIVVGVVGVRRCVVVPGGDVDDGTFRQHGRGVVRIDVVRHPLEVEMVHIAQHLAGAVGKDGFNRHRLTAKMHVGLEILEPRRHGQHMETLRLGD